MKIQELHGWNFNLAEAARLQKALAGNVVREGVPVSPRFIAGADVSAGRFVRLGRAAVVLLSYPALEVIEVSLASGEVTAPYIPGFLSFREAPLLIEAFRRLETAPDLVMVDGQGTAHPRRLGIAAHLGLFLDVPTVGCAKSRLCGDYVEPGDTFGSSSRLTDRGEIVGTVVRTKPGTKPLFISIGNKISLENAVKWTLLCCRGYRLPEPTRLAHLAAGGNLKTLAGVLIHYETERM